MTKCENVMAKLGGIAMEINGFNWHKNSIPPSGDELINRTKGYYETTLEYFGIDRSTFLINTNGKILHRWNKVKVKDHVKEVLEFSKIIVKS